MLHQYLKVLKYGLETTVFYRHLESHAKEIVFHTIVLSMAANIFVILAQSNILFLKSFFNGKHLTYVRVFEGHVNLLNKSFLGCIRFQFRECMYDLKNFI